jgi:hypothetical protein
MAGAERPITCSAVSFVLSTDCSTLCFLAEVDLELDIQQKGKTTISLEK